MAVAVAGAVRGSVVVVVVVLENRLVGPRPAPETVEKLDARDGMSRRRRWRRRRCRRGRRWRAGGRRLGIGSPTVQPGSVRPRRKRARVAAALGTATGAGEAVVVSGQHGRCRHEIGHDGLFRDTEQEANERDIYSRDLSFSASKYSYSAQQCCISWTAAALRAGVERNLIERRGGAAEGGHIYNIPPFLPDCNRDSVALHSILRV